MAVAMATEESHEPARIMWRHGGEWQQQQQQQQLCKNGQGPEHLGSRFSTTWPPTIQSGASWSSKYLSSAEVSTFRTVCGIKWMGFQSIFNTSNRWYVFYGTVEVVLVKPKVPAPNIGVRRIRPIIEPGPHFLGRSPGSQLMDCTCIVLSSRLRLHNVNRKPAVRQSQLLTNTLPVQLLNPLGLVQPVMVETRIGLSDLQTSGRSVKKDLWRHHSK